MSKPTAPQTRVLLAAVANGGRLKLTACAYAGMFAPYGGAESIIEALSQAAHLPRTEAHALLVKLPKMSLIMAGGFLDVERRDTHAAGTLADRYVAAIHSPELRVPGVTAPSVQACIRAGWLDAKWFITNAGRDALLAVDPTGYVNAIPDEQIDTELTRVTADVPRTTEPGPVSAGENTAPILVVDECPAAPNQPGAPAGKARATIDPKHLPTQTASLAAYRDSLPDPRTLDPDAKATVAATMSGYQLGDLTRAELAAAKRGINPATFRRLHPAVTHPVVAELLPLITDVRDALVEMLTRSGAADQAITVGGDPREAGYRIAVTDVRRQATSEAIRRTAFHLELALTAAEGGHRGPARASLTRGARYAHA